MKLQLPLDFDPLSRRMASPRGAASGREVSDGKAVPMRFLFYSHDGFGLGHTRRHLAIAGALTRLDPRASVLLASGSDEAHRFGLPPRVEVLKLPALRKVRNDHYVSRRLEIPAAEAQALRSELLCAAAKAYRPAVVLVDKHPFGACGEFRAALETLQRLGTRAVLGLRDILDEPEVIRREWDSLRDEIPAFFDAVLVYGERAVFDPVSAYEFPSALATRTHFCGYVLNTNSRGANSVSSQVSSANATESRRLVIAAAGGGEDGFALLEAFMRAAANASWRGVVVAGPMTPERQFDALQTLATDTGVTLHRYVPNLADRMHEADALVCMGGYNTLVEAAAAGVPTVCVPRVSPRREQAMRAAAFERLGLLRVVPPETLTPKRLRDAVGVALRDSRECRLAEAPGCLRFDGAVQAASHLRAAARGREGRRVSPARARA